MSMTIDEAIRRLDAEVMIAQIGGKFTVSDAIKLGIEALKLYQTIKADGLRSKRFRLLGEKED